VGTRNVTLHESPTMRTTSSSAVAALKEQGHGKKRFSDQYLHQKLGLYQLERTSRQRFVGERV